MKKSIAVLMLALLIVTMFAGCGDSKERKARTLYEAGDYVAAAEIFAELGDRKMQAEALYEAGQYAQAKDIYSEINDLSGVSKCLTVMRGVLNKIHPAS